MANFIHKCLFLLLSSTSIKKTAAMKEHVLELLVIHYRMTITDLRLTCGYTELTVATYIMEEKCPSLFLDLHKAIPLHVF